MDKAERTFEVNTFYERLLELRRTNPKAFGEISPASKLSLLAYEAAKREEERLQAIRDEPSGISDAANAYPATQPKLKTREENNDE